MKPCRAGVRIALAVLAAVEITKGSLVALTAAGYAVPATHDSADRIIGVADQYVDNLQGSSGDQMVGILRKQAFLFANGTGAAEIKTINLFDPCYLVDDETVGAASGTLEVGRVVELSDDGVWVEIDGVKSNGESE